MKRDSQTPTGADFISVHAGAGHSVAVKADGSLVSWGFDRAAQVTERLRRASSMTRTVKPDHSTMKCFENSNVGENFLKVLKM